MKLKRTRQADLAFINPNINEIVGYYLDYHDNHITGNNTSILMQCYSISNEHQIGYEYYCDYFSISYDKTFNI